RTTGVRQPATDHGEVKFAALRVRLGVHQELSPSCWLLLEKSNAADEPDLKAYISNANVDISRDILARLAVARSAIEGFFREALIFLGMTHYETRSWIGWRHHVCLVALAHLLVTLARTSEPRNLAARPSAVPEADVGDWADRPAFSGLL